MRRSLLLTIGTCLSFTFAFAQTFSWSGYPAGGTSYTTGIMTATVTSSAPGFQYSTPKYYAGATVGSGQCGLAGGLAFEQLFGNITTAHVTLTMDFTSGSTTNGTCSSVSFQIKDINADESVQTFADWVEISAIDGNNAAIAAGSIVASGGSNKVFTTSGSTRIIKGYNSGSYGSRATTSCDNVTITVTPPAGVPLKRIVLKYHPDYTASPNNYWNFSGPTRPAYQYISISSLTATATGGGCLVLPVELVSFTATRKERSAEINWTTASEENNLQFILERTTDGEHFETVAVVNGQGNTQATTTYSVTDDYVSDELTYYRLRQIDVDGRPTFFDLVSVEALKSDELISRVFPNPAKNALMYTLNSTGKQVFFVTVTDQTGRVIFSEEGEAVNGISEHLLHTETFNNGVYWLTVQTENGTIQTERFVKYE